MTITEIEQAVLSTLNTQAASIATQAGLPSGVVLAFAKTGENAGTGLLNPRIGLVLDVLIGDTNPNIPLT